MPDNSGGFIFAMIGISKLFTQYTGDFADKYICNDCKRELRWKDYRVNPHCFTCESKSLTLVKRGSSF